VVGIAAFREDLHAGVGGQWVSTRYRVLARPAAWAVTVISSSKGSRMRMVPPWMGAVFAVGASLAAR
ncbi:hypothetical protein, partial [Alcanivorax sp.]|uniref:hypothetical protein n=1 Tax=Alcanivorax sp. TaxID=1872427 RepID=UPI003BAB6ABF